MMNCKVLSQQISNIVDTIKKISVVKYKILNVVVALTIDINMACKTYDINQEEF